MQWQKHHTACLEPASLKLSRALLPRVHHALLSPTCEAKPRVKKSVCLWQPPGPGCCDSATALITLCFHIPPLSAHLLALAFFMMLGAFWNRNGLFYMTLWQFL